MSGPAPKHPSRRARKNNPQAGFSMLPAEGRKGAVPAWPLLPDVEMTAALEHAEDKAANLTAELAKAKDGRTKGRLRRQLDQLEITVSTLRLRLEQATDREKAFWSELWTTPQAVMWDESTAFARMVAQFVRWNVRAEQGDLKAATEARLRGAELGLSPLALLRLRREVEETKAAEDRGKERRERRAQPARRDDGGDDPRGDLYAVS